MTRRELLKTLSAIALRPRAAVASHRVGLATGAYSFPYEAVQRAIASAGNFPSVRGKTVIIKPNLVGPHLWNSGITTHPEMVRQVVDRCLSQGALAVRIVEGGRVFTPGVGGAFFSQCGYDFFRTYHPLVSLVDISLESCSLTLVPNTPGAPSAYREIYIPTVLLSPDTVCVSIGKLKTHAECGATLSTKNLFGLPPVGPYIVPAKESWRPRYQLHDRGINQAIVDICLARPIHYAIIDGGVGMEGNGPIDGVRANVRPRHSGSESRRRGQDSAADHGRSTGQVPTS